nr:MAG TPA: Sigma factor-binding transcriptional regulator Crl [Bacteriophage sp.]
MLLPVIFFDCLPTCILSVVQLLLITDDSCLSLGNVITSHLL